eukprot:scaffold854_cov276-Pinguiococcus_pyrenoidosus.AAC.1
MKELQKAISQMTVVGLPYPIRLRVPQQSSPRVCTAVLLRSDDARQDVGKALRRHHNVLALLAMRKPKYLPESVKQAQGSFAFPALYTCALCKSIPFVPCDRQRRAFLPALLPYVNAQRHVGRKEEAVHAAEASRQAHEMLKQISNAGRVLVAYVEVACNSLRSVLLSQRLELIFQKLCCTLVCVCRHKRQQSVWYDIQKIANIFMNPCKPVLIRIPNHEEAGPCVQEQAMRRRIHRLAAKIIEQELQIVRVGNLPGLEADSRCHLPLPQKALVHEAMHQARLAGPRRACQDDFGNGHVHAVLRRKDKMLRYGLSHLLDQPKILENVGVAIVGKLRRQSHGVQMVTEFDSVQFLQRRWRLLEKQPCKFLLAFGPNGVAHKVELSELRHARQSLLRQGFRAFSANGVVGKVELSELRHARQSSLRQGFRAFSANGVVGKVELSELRHAR